MDIGTELASISSDLHALANAISERHINRTTATHRARVLALTAQNLQLYIDRQSGEFGQAYAEGLDSTVPNDVCAYCGQEQCLCKITRY